VSECDREASIMQRPWPTGGCSARERKGKDKKIKEKEKENETKGCEAASISGLILWRYTSWVYQWVRFITVSG